MTDIEISNMALGWLGQEPIVTFDDGTPAAKLCKVFYPASRDACLEDRVWTFAKRQIILNALVAVPDFGYSKKFQLPSDCVRVHRVDDGTFEFKLEWDKYGREIHSDGDTIHVIYVTKLTDTSQFSAQFCQAVAARLAADICIPLTENARLQADLWSLYEKKLKDAAGTDGSQGRSEFIRSDSLASKRY